MEFPITSTANSRARRSEPASRIKATKGAWSSSIQEKSLGLDASVKKTGGAISGALSFFRNAFSGYIFERFTDEEEDGLRVVQYERRDAMFWGFETQANIQVFEKSGRHLGLEASADAPGY